MGRCSNRADPVLAAAFVLVIGWVAACSPATLVREVEFPTKPTAVEGFRRSRTVSIGAVKFEPKEATGQGEESWPSETIKAVERRLRSDLGAQPWLGSLVDKNADLRAELRCSYQANLDAKSPWVLVVPLLGALAAGAGGYMIGMTDQTTEGTTLLVVGAATLMIGGISVASLRDPPSVVQQQMTCNARFRDRYDKTILESEYTVEADGSKSLGEVIVATEDKMLTGVRDALTRLAASSGTKYESLAVLDITAGKLLTEEQRRILTKLVAAELQRHGVERVIGTDDIKALLSLDKLKQLTGCNDESCLAEVGGALGVEWLVAGSIGQLGGRYVLELRLMNVQTVTVARRTTHSGSTLERLLDVIPEMAEELVAD